MGVVLLGQYPGLVGCNGLDFVGDPGQVVQFGHAVHVAALRCAHDVVEQSQIFRVSGSQADVGTYGRVLKSFGVCVWGRIERAVSCVAIEVVGLRQDGLVCADDGFQLGGRVGVGAVDAHTGQGAVDAAYARLAAAANAGDASVCVVVRVGLRVAAVVGVGGDLGQRSADFGLVGRVSLALCGQVGQVLHFAYGVGAIPIGGIHGSVDRCQIVLIDADDPRSCIVRHRGGILRIAAVFCICGDFFECGLLGRNTRVGQALHFVDGVGLFLGGAIDAGVDRRQIVLGDVIDTRVCIVLDRRRRVAGVVGVSGDLGQRGQLGGIVGVGIAARGGVGQSLHFGHGVGLGSGFFSNVFVDGCQIALRHALDASGFVVVHRGRWVAAVVSSVVGDFLQRLFLGRCALVGKDLDLCSRVCISASDSIDFAVDGVQVVLVDPGDARVFVVLHRGHRVGVVGSVVGNLGDGTGVGIDGVAHHAGQLNLICYGLAVAVGRRNGRLHRR